MAHRFTGFYMLLIFTGRYFQRDKSFSWLCMCYKKTEKNVSEKAGRIY